MLRREICISCSDFHYEDINVNDIARRIEAVDRVLNSPSQRKLFSLPLVYMWDDHDWLGNDSLGYDGDGREAALESYKVAMPYHGPLPSNNSAYHAFTIGSVRFIISDLRSESTAGSIFSDQQKEWLLHELSQSDRYDFVVWVTVKPWIQEESDTETKQKRSDSWKGYPDDRQELSDFISFMMPKKNLIAISADAHMVAFDDGSNTFYGQGSPSDTDMNNDNATVIQSFPLLQSGPLDRLASFKGGNRNSLKDFLKIYTCDMTHHARHSHRNRTILRRLYRIQI